MYSASAQALDCRLGACAYRYRYGSAARALPMRCCAWTTEEGGIIDWDFLNKYTVPALDADHKPADLRSDVNFRDYLTASTTVWKRPRSGLPTSIYEHPVEQITELARVMGKGNNVWFMYSFASARATALETCPQIHH